MKIWLKIINYLSVLPFCQSSCCYLEKARNINYEKAIFVLLYWWFQKEGNVYNIWSCHILQMNYARGGREIHRWWWRTEGEVSLSTFFMWRHVSWIQSFFFTIIVTETMSSVWQLTSTMIMVNFYNTDYHEKWCWQYAVNDDYLKGNISGGNCNLRENSCKPRQESHLNSQKKSHM